MAQETKYSIEELRGMYEQARSSSQRPRDTNKDKTQKATHQDEDSGNSVLFIIVAASIVSIIAALGYDRSPQPSPSVAQPVNSAPVNQANVSPQPAPNSGAVQRQLPLYPQQPIEAQP